MTEADYQLTVTSVVAIASSIAAIAGSVAAIFGVKNHAVGQTNADKIDQVQKATDGSAHTLAAAAADMTKQNADAIRMLATGTTVQSPPASGI